MTATLRIVNTAFPFEVFSPIAFSLLFWSLTYDSSIDHGNSIFLLFPMTWKIHRNKPQATASGSRIPWSAIFVVWMLIFINGAEYMLLASQQQQLILCRTFSTRRHSPPPLNLLLCHRVIIAYLIHIRMPDFCQKSNRWRWIWIVRWEFHVCLWTIEKKAEKL